MLLSLRSGGLLLVLKGFRRRAHFGENEGRRKRRRRGVLVLLWWWRHLVVLYIWARNHCENSFDVMVRAGRDAGIVVGWAWC